MPHSSIPVYPLHSSHEMGLFCFCTHCPMTEFFNFSWIRGTSQTLSKRKCHSVIFNVLSTNQTPCLRRIGKLWPSFIRGSRELLKIWISPLLPLKKVNKKRQDPKSHLNKVSTRGRFLFIQAADKYKCTLFCPLCTQVLTPSSKFGDGKDYYNPQAQSL